MPRTAAQNAAMRTDTRDRIETAAVKLFARKGFAATTVRDIASEAGISTGLMYRHYKTKEALFEDLVAAAVAGLARVAEAFDQDVPPAVPVWEFTREFIADLTADNGAVEFMMLMNQAFTMPDPPAVVERLARTHEDLVARLAALVERGQRVGDFVRGNPAELATCYFALLGGLALMRFLSGDGFVVPDPITVSGVLLREEARQ